ncbi:hypothetical protein AB0K14_19455 [Actinosynnema sp. NPDC050801]|uniref:hypothetical protein n=1 Tax=unclassified Actinosynnema TaxID=2637065 RepID=UPI003411EFBC
MSTELGTYSFLPWLRQGLAGRITEQDGDTNATSRASVHVQLDLHGEPVGDGQPLLTSIGRDVQLYGPGDVIGLDRRVIMREEPRGWITDVEPNFLAHVEFYDESLPWRYTPAAPDPAELRLRPWLTLVVLEEVPDGNPPEFTEGGHVTGRPLPHIDLADLALLPPAADLWAWAHVHLNTDLATTPGADVPEALRALLDEHPDRAYSRLICPRRLRTGAAYHAFLVPTFETGRLAGLGLDPATAPYATASAWAPYPDGHRPASSSMPIYHRWYFRTGAERDFETLVRLLEPRPVDNRVGVRDLDVRDPGQNLPGIDDPALGGMLKLGGALRVPRANFSEQEWEVVERYENWADADEAQPFRTALGAWLTLPDDYQSEGGDPDPLITAPIYASWHALTRRLLVDRDGTPADPDDNWVHELNLDPRHRVAAGFGTRVVQDQQERFMAAAWEQVGDVLAANRRIRFAQLAMEVAALWQAEQLAPLAAARPGRLLAITAPTHRHVRHDGVTVRHLRTGSLVPPALTSAAMRRLTRPGSRLMRSLLFDKNVRPDNLVERVNEALVSAAPLRPTPPGLVTTDDLADAAGDGALDVIRPESLTREMLDRTKRLPDFAITEPGGRDHFEPGERDSETAVKLKEALRGWHDLHTAGAAIDAKQPKPGPVDLPGLAGGVVAALDPLVTVPRRTWYGISVPPRITEQLDEDFGEVMAYPEFDVPMYESLKDISAELFLPNLDLIQQNTLTLLETNQKFIESYLVGLNHEFGRELLWREYPTDQRGSFFRQFWDPRGAVTPAGLTEDERRELLRDIPPINTWLRHSGLGEHDHREQQVEAEEEVVLVIRGELLKKYPNAVIYAQKAQWPGGDQTKERELVPLTPAQEADPPRSVLRTPLYAAKIDPDITFLGFDLTVAEAHTGAGWFFVIRERPGEARFGLDLARDPATLAQTVNDLVWSDTGTQPGGFLPACALGPPLPLDPVGPGEAEKEDQHDEDVAVAATPASAARWAYLLYQAPVMVAVHATEMLGEPDA